MEYDCHVVSKYLVFQSKHLVFQSKYLIFQSSDLVFWSKTFDFDQKPSISIKTLGILN